MGNLAIPGFTDFLSEMGEARIVQWSTDAARVVRSEIGMAFDLSSPEDAKGFVTAITALNQRATINMLQDYHAWLIDKLDRSSLHLI